MIRNILRGSWVGTSDGNLSATILRQIVCELDDHEISHTMKINAIGPDGNILYVKELRFEEDCGTPPVGAPE